MSKPSLIPKLKAYYQEANFILPSYSFWRMFKFKLINNWLRLRKRVRDVSTLRQALLKFVPLDIYYSVSLWLNPSVVSYNVFNKFKGGYNLAYNLFFDGDLIFDIDGEGKTIEEKIEDAKNKTLKNIEILKSLGYKNLRIVFTGGKGFRIDVLDYRFPREKYNLLPNQVMWCYYFHKKQIVDEVRELGGKFCYDVSLDIKRVIRLIGSVNSSTGYVCSAVKNLENFNLEEAERIEF